MEGSILANIGMDHSSFQIDAKSKNDNALCDTLRHYNRSDDGAEINGNATSVTEAASEVNDNAVYALPKTSSTQNLDDSKALLNSFSNLSIDAMSRRKCNTADRSWADTFTTKEGCKDPENNNQWESWDDSSSDGSVSDCGESASAKTILMGSPNNQLKKGKIPTFEFSNEKWRISYQIPPSSQQGDDNDSSYFSQTDEPSDSSEDEYDFDDTKKSVARGFEDRHQPYPNLKWPHMSGGSFQVCPNMRQKETFHMPSSSTSSVTSMPTNKCLTGGGIVQNYQNNDITGPGPIQTQWQTILSNGVISIPSRVVTPNLGLHNFPENSRQAMASSERSQSDSNCPSMALPSGMVPPQERSDAGDYNSKESIKALKEGDRLFYKKYPHLPSGKDLDYYIRNWSPSLKEEETTKQVVPSPVFPSVENNFPKLPTTSCQPLMQVIAVILPPDTSIGPGQQSAFYAGMSGNSPRPPRRRLQQTIPRSQRRILPKRPPEVMNSETRYHLTPLPPGTNKTSEANCSEDIITIE